jgi:hypothetical protein
MARSNRATLTRVRQAGAPAKGIRLEAMALEIPDFPGHPNRVPFSGVLTAVDRPSDRAPHGAAGHLVLLPRAAAERALASLLGMAVDYAPGLRGHDTRRKIGVITRAEISGDRIEVAGHLFGKDFPDVIDEIRARRERLGMSYEVAGARVRDRGAKVWVLDEVVFTGAAILERGAAAYQTTSLAAHAAGAKEGATMDERILEALAALEQSNQALAGEVSRLREAVEQFGQANAALAAAGDIETRAGEPATFESLRRQNQALSEHAERLAAQAARKTVPPQVMTLLAKAGVSTDWLGGGRVELPALDKALEGLPLEQRIAVKSQLARAGALD